MGCATESGLRCCVAATPQAAKGTSSHQETSFSHKSSGQKSPIPSAIHHSCCGCFVFCAQAPWRPLGCTAADRSTWSITGLVETVSVFVCVVAKLEASQLGTEPGSLQAWKEEDVFSPHHQGTNYHICFYLSSCILHAWPWADCALSNSSPLLDRKTHLNKKRGERKWEGKQMGLFDLHSICIEPAKKNSMADFLFCASI